MGTPARRGWSDYSPWARVGIALAGLVEFGLLGAALADLRRRGPAEVNGPRWMWALVSLVNFVGPITYFAVGRGRAVGTGRGGTHGRPARAPRHCDAASSNDSATVP